MTTIAKGKLYDPSGKQICGAKTRTCTCGHHRVRHENLTGACAECGCQKMDARPCRQCGKSLLANGRCKTHHGRVKVGREHHLFKHGRYSMVAKALPKELAQNYAIAVEDPQLLSLRSEIATTRVLAVEALKRISETKEAGAATFRAAQSVRKAWRSFEYAHDNGGDLDVAMTRVTDAVVALSNSVSPAQLAAEAREEHRRAMHTLARLEQVEGQSLETLHNMITAERAFAMRQHETDIFLEALNELEPSPEVRNAIRLRVGTRLGELAARRDRPAMAPGVGPAVVDAEPVDPAPADG